MAAVKVIKKQPIHLKNVKKLNSLKVNIKDNSPKTQIRSNLPFRIKISNVVVPGYKNPPGVGARIIGVNNYIL